MLKYILLGLAIFIGYKLGALIGSCVLIIILGYTIYANIPSFIAMNGNKALNEGNLENALKSYKKAYKTGRANDSVSLTYGILSLRCGYTDDALEVFNNIIFNQKSKASFKNQAKQYRTLTYYKMGQVEDAIEEAEEIFQKYKSTVSYGLLCYLKHATNQPIEEVLPLCEEAYEYNSDDRDIVDNLAYAYIKNNEFEKAKKLVDDMLEKFPAFTEAYYHGAIVYSKLGDTKKAKELLDLIPEKCTRTYLTTVSVEEIENLKNSLN